MQPTLITRPTVRTVSPWPWLMVFGRMGLFILGQVLFAIGFSLAGASDAWQASAAWWPFSVGLANAGAVALLVGLFRGEGARFWDSFRLQREHLKQDLLVLLGFLVLMGPIAFLPNILLANALLGGPQAAVELMLRPLPAWAAYASLLVFPITQGLAELPTYFAYGMPRLEAQGLPRWLALALPAIMLGLQHMAVPLLFDVRYLAWRGLMFLPFAFSVGLSLQWRPRLLPYMVIIHILMDLSFVAMLLGVAT
jgi:hypothetical protein